MAQENKEFTLEDILAEQRAQREVQAAEQAAQEDLREAAEATPAPADQPAPEAEPAQPPREEAQADLNDYATGALDLTGQAPSAPEEAPPQEEATAPEKGKKKKKRRGLFGWKKRVPDFDENEDDLYYGIQLKPIDEYRMGYDPSGELTSEEETYKALFDDSKKALDDEVEQNFQRLQQERRRRVTAAVQNAGVDEKEIADEFGVVAPMPVTSFAADPYARQHGIALEGAEKSGEVSQLQQAMMEASDQTMEIKLNVMNDTVELQRVGDEPLVSEEAVERVLAAPQAPQEKAPAPQASQEGPVLQVVPPQPAGEEVPQEEPAQEQTAQEEPAQEKPSQEEPAQEEPAQEEPAGEKPGGDTAKVPPAPTRPSQEPPQVTSIYEYRARGVATHVIHAQVLQSALLSESEGLRQDGQQQETKVFPKRRVRNKKLETQPEPEPPVPDADTGESIEDYTGPEDAKSISHELRGEMRELTMRMMITGVATVLLAMVNLIFGLQFGGPGDPGSLPVVYVVLTLVFLAVSVGICYRTVANGLKALFAFNANSDSAAAVAAVAVAIQAVAAAFFRTELTRGELHLYAVVLSAILFVNSVGKLTMIRRIHSNFRFVTSREQKYSVRVYGDHNTALKMAKDCVSESPVIAYQCPAGFLKRFLELSYKPDPAESASQLLAPVGLIASLVLTIACLLLTSSVPAAISAFAAASCACVAVTNLLSVNLPISRLCRTARRAGAMVVGYEGVEELGGANAVMVDAQDLFPCGTVVLNGIKTFGNRALAEEAVMAASALMNQVGGPLSGVFEQVINENEDALPQVEGFTCEDGAGIVGKVDGKTVYVGSRALLVNHQLQAPAREEEAQYASGGQQVIYLAVEESVAALLVLTYNADRRRKNELQRLEDSGVSVIVRTTDPNVTSQLVSRLFGIDNASVGVLDPRLGEEYRKAASSAIPRADALVATKGRMESMMSVVSACVEAKRSAGMLVAIQNAAVVLGFVLVAFLACFGAMAQLSSLILFLFQLFWVAVILLLPKLRR